MSRYRFERKANGKRFSYINLPGRYNKISRTDANGHYEFGGLKDGETYTVKFETPAGYLPTKKMEQLMVKKDSNGSSVTVKINGKDDMSLDTGFIKNLNIILVTMYGKIQIKMVSKMLMNLVSKDVKVTLKDSTGKVIGTTTTDASGKYKFTDLDNATIQ